VRRNLLALSFFPAFTPPTNGGVERLFRMYSELSRRFDVTLITSGELNCPKVEIQHRPGFREIRVPKDSYFESCYVSLSDVAGKGDLSGPALGLATQRYGMLHAEFLTHYVDADIIVHDSPFLIACDLLRGFDNKPRVYQSYNVESELYASFHSAGDGSRSVERLVRSLEEDLCRNATLITACSEEDRKFFVEHFRPTCPVTIAPNGFAPRYAVDERAERATNRLLFMGSGHQPNVEAAALIREKLAPAFPDHEFHIVGNCLPAGRVRNVVSHGFVDQEAKQRLLRTATAAINPMLSGSGSSLKVADFADHNLALISTSQGTRGFDLRPFEHFLPLAPETIVEDLRAALADRSVLKTVAGNSRRHFREHFTWKKIGEQFADQIDALCDNRPTARPRLVLNDHDSFVGVGGGATRTRGLCQGLSESGSLIFLTFAGESGDPLRRAELNGAALLIQIEKSAEHIAEHQADQAAHWVSTADLVNYRHSELSAPLLAAFKAAASVASRVLCEHPYMVGLLKRAMVDFTYSSQNFELALKREVLAGHPRLTELAALAHEAEAFACGSSSLIVAVSEGDARQLSGNYRFTAPIMIVPNGSETPFGSITDGNPSQGSTLRRRSAVFMGSAHVPNVEAACWINESLAPLFPQVDFVIVGNVGLSIAAPAQNVTLTGVLDAEEKSRILHTADVALNPMLTGSGSNVKMADFLQHGLKVISTGFGARGYEGLPSDDVTVVPTSMFADELSAILEGRDEQAVRRARAERYRASLSMDEGGRQLAALLAEHEGDRKRAVYVTYRYTDPTVGGGEAYVVRLAHALAKSGWFVDVVSPAAEKIGDVDRFEARFSGPDFQPVPTGIPRVRSGKFALDDGPEDGERLGAIWGAQPMYETVLFRSLPAATSHRLAWGWSHPDDGGRWAMRDAAIALVRPASVSLLLRPVGKLWMQITTDAGDVLVDKVVADRTALTFEAPEGLLEIRCSPLEPVKVADPRPLGLFVERCEVGGGDLLGQQILETWCRDVPATEVFAAHEKARSAARDGLEGGLTDLRMGSRELLGFLEQKISSYDLVLTHNAAFGVPIEAVRLASEAGVPSVFVPHLHYDDDFYHFPDVIRACEQATATLVTPRELAAYLRDKGLSNVHDHGPGINAGSLFTDDDSRAFRELLGNDREFVLVLGRKAGAKGYGDVIAAIEGLDEELQLVLIGPDDDGLPITSGRAIYLGRQPDDVVRGALRECMALVNMSRSESFGIVLLEAGLAGAPVLANRACAAFRDLVTDDANGYLVGPENLAAVISKLRNDPELRTRLGAQGRTMALKHDWKAVERDFVALCNDLVQTR
jgi:glycosyltransferase involved in cell wall biosynthesis